MFCCPSRSSSARSSASAFATRSPPQKRRGCGWRGTAARVSGGEPQAHHRRQRGGNRALDLSPLCRTRFGPVVEGRAGSPEHPEQVADQRRGAHLGGKPFARGALYLMLQNRIYRGEIVHNTQSYPGEHEPIIDQPLWEAVQTQVASNAAQRNDGGKTRR